MRIAFIINSNSTKAKKVFGTIRNHIQHEYKAFHTTEPGSAIAISSACIKDDFTHLAVLGGDGTINEVFNGMMRADKTAEELPILCILPCGTGNDLARNFSLTADTQLFLQRLDHGVTQYSDGGSIQYTNALGVCEQRFFINVMDIGLGGLIAQRVNQYRRGLLAFLSYQRSIVRTLPLYVKRFMTIRTSSIIYSGPAMSVVVANGKWFGNGLGIAPEAKCDDGQLDCVILAKVNTWDYVWNLPAIFRCKPIKHKQVHYSLVKELIVEGDANPIEIDGEFVGFSPAQIKVIPRTVRLLIG
jgi:diacylglycerol kinase (ATP)